MLISPAAAKRSVSRPDRLTWTSARCTATARPSACWRAARMARPSPFQVPPSPSRPPHKLGDSVCVMTVRQFSTDEIRSRVEALGPWFHNLDLGGVRTAPSHFLGDYPAVKWQRFADAISPDLAGRSVLDIGCNAGFYSMEMKRRGASRVLGIDSDDEYLTQARFAAEVNEMEIEFRNLSVYDVASLGEKFDVVLF